MMRYISKRLLAVCVLVGLLAGTPWYVFTCGLVIFAWYYDVPVAALLLGAMADVVYGSAVWFGGWPFFLLVAVLCTFVAPYSKKLLRIPGANIV